MEMKQTFLKRNGLLSVLFAVLFLVFPFWSGLFFPIPTAYSSMAMALLALLLGIWSIIRKSEAKGFTIMDGLVTLYTLVVLLSIFSYSNLEFTLTGIAKQFGFLFVYLIVRMRATSLASIRSLFYVIGASGAVLSVYGLLNGFNVLHHDGAIFLGTGERRLASAFEYPNSYASYLAIALLFGISVQAELKKWGTRWLWLFLNALSFIGLILTYSRGGWVVFAVALILMAVLAPTKRRAPLIVHAVAAIITMGAGLPLISSASAAGTAGKGYAGLAIALVVALVLSFAVGRVSAKSSELTMKKSVLIPAALAIVLVGGFAGWKALPADVVNRITSINFQLFSVQQRLVFYKDGFSAVKDHPIIGAGNRTWEATFLKYQSYPYYTTSPHSVLVDQVMNTGLLGTLLFLGIFVWTLRGLWKLRKGQEESNAWMGAALFAAFLELVLHAMVDVDFNYAVIGYLFWTLVAIGALGSPLAVESVTAMNAWKWNPKNRWVWWTMSAVSLVVLAYSASYVYASNQLDKAKSNLGQPGLAATELERADALAPYLKDLASTYAGVDDRYYQRTNDPTILKSIQERLAASVKYAPNSADLLAQTGTSLLQHQKPLDGVELYKLAWENAPYRAEYGEAYMNATTQLGEAYLKSNQKEAIANFHKTLDTYHQIEQRIAGFKDLPPVLHLERPYAITGMMNQQAAISAFYLQQYADAKRLATAALQDQKTNKTILNALLMAIDQKQGKGDQARLQQFLQNKSNKAQYDQFMQGSK